MKRIHDCSSSSHYIVLRQSLEPSICFVFQFVIVNLRITDDHKSSSNIDFDLIFCTSDSLDQDEFLIIKQVFRYSQKFRLSLVLTVFNNKLSSTVSMNKYLNVTFF